MNLLSLPLDVLLAILRSLNIVDIIHTGMTCKDLYGIVQDRHVWVDRLVKLRRKYPVLGPATPPLACLSARELKTFYAGWVKLRLRWTKYEDDKENGFAAQGLIGIPGIHELRLLPGGKTVLVVNNQGGVTLRRIELKDGQVSLPIVANLEYDRRVKVVGPRWSKLLIAMSPCPILIHRQESKMHLVKVDHHNGVMSLETTFPIPEGYRFLEAHGQGRAIGFLIQKTRETTRATIIHLDYPGVSLEFKVSPAYADEAKLVWNICIPTENQVIIYNTLHILAFKIPNFSSLSLGINTSKVTPTWHWPIPHRLHNHANISVSYITSGVLYNPSSVKQLDLHYVFMKRVQFLGYTHLQPFLLTIPVPINAKDDLAHEWTKPSEFRVRSRCITKNGREQTVGPSCRTGLHSDIAIHNDRIDALVMPLDDLFLGGGREALWMSVTYKELRDCKKTVDMDMDEATGRVIIWGWEMCTYETKVFVGDLV